jgi:ABC-type multidrug transport system fused ATPase/permease subunit
MLTLRGGDLGQVLPALGLYAFAAYRMLPAAQIIYRGITQMRSGAAALRHLHEELESPEGDLRPAAAIDTFEPLPLARAISLRDVSFGYGGEGSRQSLAKIDLEIKANTSVGIIGTSGAGKSTLIDVLLGLLEPDSGEIRIDDVLLKPENAVAWRATVGYVPQQIFLMDSTLAENVAFGVPPEQIDTDRVERAARAAQLHEFIVHSLPLAYQTVIGERGVRISGGERQRLGLARALYRDPSVLLLDEATSALDIATEATILSAIDSLKGTRTIIMIAHRLSSVEGCDEVVLLDHGRVTQTGSPRLVIARARELWQMAGAAETQFGSVVRPLHR